MPILLVLLLVASVLDVSWPAAAVSLSPTLVVGVIAGMVAFSVLTSLAVSVRTSLVLKHHPDRRSKATRLYSRWRRVAFWLNIAITATAIFALGWGQWVRATFVQEVVTELAHDNGTVFVHHSHRLFPFAELLVPAPYLLTLVLNWFAYWPAERALFRANHPDRVFWSLFGFWLNNARQFFFPAFLMVLMQVAHQTAGRLFPETSHQWWYLLGSSVAGLGVLMCLPLVIRPLLGLQRLPAGPTRDRLEASARRLGVKFTDFLLWPTRGVMANAMVIGVIPWARYVIFTDGLLEGLEPDELDAVFGHEAGHARYGHLPYYMLFLSASGAGVLGVVLLVAKLLEMCGITVDPPDWFTPFLPFPPFVVMGIYLFGVFGWLSRVCERQADIYGSRAGSCGNPDCTGHDADTVLNPRGRGLCPTGLRAMVRALEKVLVLNGWDSRRGRGNLFQRMMSWVRAWQHGPMPVRMDYLLGLIDRPERADRHDRFAFWVRVGLVLTLLAVAAVGAAVSGREVLEWVR